ncbi:MAG TPA: mandelate racemase/muconate lactonizing enzyme family protein [Terriglobia bacterium]|nr:mandelate racemase/muconate lactonizing enzyme family protein [Terriglobia bacterium]
MDRRSILKSLTAAGAGVAAYSPRTAAAAQSGVTAQSSAATPAAPGPIKITRIRFYHNPTSPPSFNQSFHIVTVETDQGITGIGEGGSKGTIEQCAAMIIGEDAFNTDHLWQMMFRGYFYPAGREKLDALGAIDLALWDTRGKALGVPVYDLIGGLARNHVECYSTGFPRHGTLEETARACIEAGFRAFRYATADPPAGQAFNSHQAVRQTYADCAQVRAGVGKDGDWALDYHTRFDFPDAVRLSALIEPLEPYFAEDLVRSEDPGVYRELRAHVKVPIAVGEQFGSKWDIRDLIEQQLIDYARVTLPNVGGITEYLKIAALCETHSVGLIPHFTGPVAEAALVHACAPFPGPVLMEMLGDGLHTIPHLPECYDFRDGKMWPNRRPGLGVTLDTKPLQLVSTITKRVRPIPMLERPDGSITNW